MKKIVAGCFLMAFAVVSHAQYSGPNAASIATTVKQLQDVGKDDQQVRLQGYILQNLGDEKYMFADDTGQILVEIDHDRWPAGQTINEKTKVELVGEYDKEIIGRSKVDVDGITVIR